MEHSGLFGGVGWFFYYVCWQLKAGGKHAGNLEASELGGAGYFTTAQPNSFPKAECWIREGWKVHGDLLCGESKQRKDCPEGDALSFTERCLSALSHALFKNKLNKTDLRIAARGVCVLWPLQAPACWIHRSPFYFIPGKQRKDVLPNALCS